MLRALIIDEEDDGVDKCGATAQCVGDDVQETVLVLFCDLLYGRLCGHMRIATLALLVLVHVF